MDRIFRIVKREYLAGVRTKWFVLSTILGPVLLTGMMAVPALLITSGSDETRCAVIDETGRLFASLQ